MGILLKDNMKAVLIGLALVAVVAANEIDVTDSASDRLFGLLCCNTVRSRCVLACAGQDCTRTCTGLCGVFASRCGPYTCSTLTTACNPQVQLLCQHLHQPQHLLQLQLQRQHQHQLLLQHQFKNFHLNLDKWS